MLKVLSLVQIFKDFLVILEQQTRLVADYLEEALEENANE